MLVEQSTQLVPATKDQDQKDTAKVMQAQIASIFAIQSMQDYLKYLILTTSMAEGKSRPSIAQLEEANSKIKSSVSPPSISSLDSPQKTSGSLSDTKISSPIREEIETSYKEEFNYYNADKKRSHRLWNLMAKKYSTKKIKLAEQKIEELNESTEEGETYRNLNGVLIPVLKSQVVHIKRQNICGHPQREHYARGLCGSCYHRTGRDKKPWNCNHERLYALGLCHKCYTTQNRLIRKKKQQLDSQSSNDMAVESKQDSQSSNYLIIETKCEEEALIKQEC